MANAIHVTDKDGNEKIIIVASIKGIDKVEAEPEEKPVAAADAVEDDPGEEPNPYNLAGRPPKKGHDAVEAKAGKPGKPEGAVIHSDAGDVEVGVSLRHLLNLINS